MSVSVGIPRQALKWSGASRLCVFPFKTWRVSPKSQKSFNAIFEYD